MTETISDLAAMLAGLNPVLDPQSYEFVTADEPRHDALATFREEEGWSSIVPAADGSMCRITLRVYSALEGVGLTAAVASLLADHKIACNMVAAFHHDHLFVPAKDSARALDLLKTLQSGSSPAAADDPA